MAALGATAIHHLVGTLGRFRTSSVLAPLHILLIIVGVLTLLWTWTAGVDHLLTWVLVIAAVVVGGADLLFYCIWSVANPDRLQTEEYRLEERRISVIGDERRPGAGAELIDSEPLTSNTAIEPSK